MSNNVGVISAVYKIQKMEYVGPTGHLTDNIAQMLITGEPKEVKKVIQDYNERVIEEKRTFWIDELIYILKQHNYESQHMSIYDVFVGEN